jgi:hypothetical protein
MPTPSELKMSKLNEFLRGLRSESQLRDFLRESRIIADDLSIELIKRIGGPHSPMSVSDLPIPNFPRDAALGRLYELEKEHVLTSKLMKKGRNYERVFEATPLARALSAKLR